MKTVVELFLEKSQEFADRLAFRDPDGSMDYGTLAASAQSTAAAVALHSAEKLGLWVKSPQKYLSGFYGGLLSGRPLFLFDSEIPSDGVVDLCKTFGVSLLITDEIASAPDLSVVKPALAERGVEKEAGKGALPGREVTKDDFAIVLLTSGTTGKRRAVPVTHENLAWTSQAFNDYLGLSDAHKELVLIPLTHSFGVRRLIAQMLVGGSIHRLAGKFNQSHAYDCMEEQQIDVLSAVPTHIRGLMHFKSHFEKSGGSLRHIELSSAFMSASEKEALVESLPKAQVVMGYGLTEATRTALLRLHLESDKLKTVGRPFPEVTISILGGEGQELGVGEVGEIRVSGPNVAKGYFYRAHLETELFRQGFKTGDVGSLNEEGYLTLLGRRDDVINVGGRKVHPAEVESLLFNYYPSLDCALTSLEHRSAGAVPILCLGPTDLERKALLELLGGRLEPYKVPSRVVQLGCPIPRTGNGKVKRQDLQKLLEEIAPLSRKRKKQ
jgi:long-chain acyl-CoA synthetase